MVVNYVLISQSKTNNINMLLWMYKICVNIIIILL
jgi:hypothetical protein